MNFFQRSIEDYFGLYLIIHYLYQVSTPKMPMDISEKNETIYSYMLRFVITRAICGSTSLGFGFVFFCRCREIAIIASSR